MAPTHLLGLMVKLLRAIVVHKLEVLLKQLCNKVIKEEQQHVSLVLFVVALYSGQDCIFGKGSD